MKSKSIWVYFISLLSILLWSMSYLWSNQLIALNIPVEYFVYIRVFIAGILLLIFNLILGKSIKIKRPDIWKFLLLSLCEPFIYFICETHGLEYTESPTFSSLIISSTPILSIVAGMLFFKEKLSLINLLGMFICIGGIVLVTLSHGEMGEKFILGIILLLVAMCSEVGHASCIKALSGDYSPEVIIMYQFLIGSIYLTPLFYWKGLANFNPSLYLSWEVFKPILYLAVLCSSLAFSLWVSTIKNLGVAKSSIFLATIPIFTAIIGLILGTEEITAIQWIGVGVATIGVILSQFSMTKKVQKELQLASQTNEASS